MAGVFGKLDKKRISNNPFFVKEGEYAGVVKKIYTKSFDNGDFFYIQYRIVEDEKYKNTPVTERFHIYPELDDDSYDELDEDEKAEVDKNLAGFRRRLENLGVDFEEDVDEEWTGADLLDIDVDLGITNWGDKSDQVNVSWVRKAED